MRAAPVRRGLVITCACLLLARYCTGTAHCTLHPRTAPHLALVPFPPSPPQKKQMQKIRYDNGSRNEHPAAMMELPGVLLAVDTVRHAASCWPTPPKKTPPPLGSIWPGGETSRLIMGATDTPGGGRYDAECTCARMGGPGWAGMGSRGLKETSKRRPCPFDARDGGPAARDRERDGGSSSTVYVRACRNPSTGPRAGGNNSESAKSKHRGRSKEARGASWLGSGYSRGHPTGDDRVGTRSEARRVETRRCRWWQVCECPHFRGQPRETGSVDVGMQMRSRLGNEILGFWESELTEEIGSSRDSS